MSVPIGRVPGARRRLGNVSAGAAIVGLSTLAAHQATYLASSGSGEALAEAMSAGGHDPFWLPLVATVLCAALVLMIVAIRRIVELAAHAARHPGPHGPNGSLDDYARIVGALWLRLAGATVVAYALQENLERVIAGLAPPGIDALVAHGLLPILVILFTSLLVAAVVALVRWRCRTLLARIGAGIGPVRRSTTVRPRIVPSRRRARRWAASCGSRAPPRFRPAT